MKQFLLIISFFLTAVVSRGQTAKQSVYYLADTIGVSPSNRILSIQREGNFEGYVFHCRCIQKNKYIYPAFIYDVDKASAETSSKLPKHAYVSWRELEEMLYQKQQGFDSFYSLEIVEKLPDGRYKTNKVRLSIIKAVVTQ